MTPILADAGVPVFMMVFPWAFFLIVPIIAIETWAARRIASVSARRRFLGVLTANMVSTIIGWPLTGVIMAIFEILVFPTIGDIYHLPPPFDMIATVTLGAAWLPPDENNLYWMFPVAVLVLLVPAFFVSVWTEGFVLRFIWREVNSTKRRSFAWMANLASYALLYAVGIFFLLYSIIHFHKQ